MPPVAGEFHIDARQLRPLPYDDLVDAQVVFERIKAADVIVVRIDIAPHEPAALIDFAGDGPESHGQPHIAIAGLLNHAQIEHRPRAFGRLREHMARLRRSRLIGDNFPNAAFALSRAVRAPFRWELACISSRERERAGRAINRWKNDRVCRPITACYNGQACQQERDKAKTLSSFVDSPHRSHSIHTPSAEPPTVDCRSFGA